MIAFAFVKIWGVVKFGVQLEELRLEAEKPAERLQDAEIPPGASAA